MRVRASASPIKSTSLHTTMNSMGSFSELGGLSGKLNLQQWTHSECCTPMVVGSTNQRSQPKMVLQGTYGGQSAHIGPQQGLCLGMDSKAMACKSWLVPDLFEEGCLHGWSWMGWCCPILQWSVLTFDGQVWKVHGEVDGKQYAQFWPCWAPPESWQEEDHPHLPGWKLISCRWIQVKHLVSSLLHLRSLFWYCSC